MAKKYYSQANRPPHDHEPGGGKSIVETAGYIPTKVRIEQFVLAGQRLDDFRKQQFPGKMYDFEGENIDYDYEDPTRRKDFNEMEAKDLQRSVNDVFDKVKVHYNEESKIEKKKVDNTKDSEGETDESKKDKKTDNTKSNDA